MAESALQSSSSNQEADQNESGEASTFAITIKTLAGKKFEVHVTSESTILDLKEKVKDLMGTPEDQQRLIFAAKQLEDDKSIQSYSIKPGVTLHLIFRLMAKPVIYIFSSTPTEVTVSLQLGASLSFSTLYPVIPMKKSDEGYEEVTWDVLTTSKDNLIERASGLEVSYLYWEAEAISSLGYITPPNSPVITTRVPKPERKIAPIYSLKINSNEYILLPVENLPKYLDKVLSTLGLHTEARTSFITFWLPGLLKYQQIALRFLHQNEYDALARLSVKPSPSSITRVFMIWKGINEAEINAGREDWERASRRAIDMDVSEWRDIIGCPSMNEEDTKGLRVVEWGGMEII